MLYPIVLVVKVHASVVGFYKIRILKYTSFVPGSIFLNCICQAEVLILMKS
jgi:hypothetical protein